eukprot:624641_1
MESATQRQILLEYPSSLFPSLFPSCVFLSFFLTKYLEPAQKVIVPDLSYVHCIGFYIIISPTQGRSTRFQRKMDTGERPSVPKIVSFFAHKGGVSKTTNVYHLGWMLAREYDMRVLMIDADPQCNLTHTLCKEARKDVGWRDDTARGNIYTAVKRVHLGQLDPDDRELQPADCVKIDRVTADLPECQGGLYLLPGSLQLSSIEPQLGLAHQMSDSDKYPIFRNLAGAFRELFVRTGAFYYADFVLVDMGPSIGELNQNLFFASDYFVIPACPDAYSRSTVLTMNEVLPKWAVRHQRLVEDTRDHDMPVKPEPTKLLGVIMSMFSVSSSKAPVKQSQMWMDIVEQELCATLLPTLERYGMSQVNSEDLVILGRIPNFLSLMPLSQRVDHPVFCLPSEGLLDLDKEGNPVMMSSSETKRQLDRARPFYNIYLQLAQVFMDACGV